MTRNQLINLIIKKYRYRSYLEIGVSTPEIPGWNFGHVDIKIKHGVDPRKEVNATYIMTSDDFFNNHIKMKYDIIFIDGLHIFDQAYRDIINSLKWLNEGGTIIVHDCNPIEEHTQREVPDPYTWHGDVWKAILKLRMERPDLSIYTVDTDQGCVVIRKGAQDLFTADKNSDMYNFSFFDKNRKAILNLISVKEFKKKMGFKNVAVSNINEFKRLMVNKIKKIL